MDGTAERRIEELDEATCRALLRTAAIGRIAFTEGALPAVQPVAFVVDGAEIVIPTRRGSKVTAASRHTVVAFEVDDVDLAERTGWNVTVVGPSRVIEDPDEIHRLDAYGVRPWAPGGAGHCYVGITVGLLRGRRVHRDGQPQGPRCVPAGFW
ncbi:pyridoxamine 5'-phosphate oxidase family protein [Klenkia terrae]|uniref:Pyridoxamine 5'-phosphate oxidase family protein n=1 Tax=Klenkia terrae TaxID=1052259 RepID=A0ABU8EB51_9ACTN|nr:pyridoxamine 5'-phosphate oxidase family protein [Klenkia terrae]SSC25733.1 Pyridoxamine 5'-phosphate oxidase-related [Klenkia terrae]